MLTREIVHDMIECRLTDAAIIEHFERLTSDRLDVETLRLFVDSLEETLDDSARELSKIFGLNDPSGTGGSGISHFNTSTAVAFVLAAGEMKVAKFGNRAAQSKSGSFDLLDAIGVPSHVPPKAVPELLAQVGVAFLFAPQYYPGLAKLAPLRKSFGKRTVFNILGPLLNPVRPNYRVMGVSCPQAQRVIGDYLSRVPSNRRSLIVRSDRGLDELEPYANNTVVDAMQGYVGEARLNDLPASEGNRSDRAGKAAEEMSRYSFTPQENYQLFLDLVKGEGPEYLTDLVCLNAAAGFVANCCSSIDACFDMAKSLIKSGKVAAKVEDVRRAYAGFASR